MLEKSSFRSIEQDIGWYILQAAREATSNSLKNDIQITLYKDY